MNTLIGGNTNSVYLIVNSIGTPSGEGLDFINGMVFLERFYTAYDSGKNMFSIAETQFTRATSN